MGKLDKTPPILRQKAYEQSSVFIPENLLRESRRQNALPPGSVPEICVLDPDGDIVENLLARSQARPNEYWACYHTKMYDFECGDTVVDILAVEMEAAALYAFARARSRPVICFAHVTNQMGNVEGDFEKGEEDGSRTALQLIAATAKAWQSRNACHNWGS